MSALPDTLVAETRDAVALLRLSRPHKRNALDAATVRGLERFFTDPPDGVRAVVLHGEGAHFCAGLDLSDVVEHDTAAGIAHSRMWHRAFAAIEFGAVPVVACLHGAVVGGGLELAASAHVRVAEASAFYALPEGQRGIFVGGGGSVRVSRLIGVARMADMMLTGRTYGAADGERIGLSQYVVEDGAGLARALELAEAVAGNAPLTNFAVVQALPRIAEAAPETGLLMEALMAAIAAGDPAAKERLRAFLDKSGAKSAGKVAHA